MRIALVLGSGGAKGYAHIGVIEELKARGHEISVISGASMGAVIGGLEAAGVLGDFRDWASSLSYFDVLRFMDIGLGRGGILKAERIISRIGEICGDVNIEDLPIPYTAVSSDVTAQREVWFQRGPLTSAMRASIGIPGFIAPVLLDEHLLVDGGVLNPIPVEPTLAVPTDVTVAVSLHGRDPFQASQLIADAGNVESLDEDSGDSSVFSRFIGDKIAGFFSQNSHDAEEMEAEIEEERRLIVADGRASIVEVMEKSLTVLEDRMEQVRKAISPANVYVEVPADVCSTWDFHRADEVSEVGRELAIDAFDCAGL